MIVRSKYPRSVLNEIKWKLDINKCKVYYIHRGAPGNVNIIDGNAIKTINRAFLILEGYPYEVYIPYHRIFRIDYDDEIVFERPQSKKKNNLEMKDILKDEDYNENY